MTTSGQKKRRFVWKLPLSPRDASDLRFVNRLLERLDVIERTLLLARHDARMRDFAARLQTIRAAQVPLRKSRHFILQRARSAYRLSRGWRPHPSTRLEIPYQPGELK